jgi:hypothetical protein
MDSLHSKAAESPLTPAERQAFAAAIKTAISAVGESPKTRQEPHMVWKRQQNGWGGSYENAEHLDFSWDRGVEWENIGSDLQRELETSHPEHLPLAGTMIGGQFAMSAGRMLAAAVATLWAKRRSLRVESAEIDAIIEDYSQFFASHEVEMSFVTPIINLRSPIAQPIAVDETLSMRALTDDEMTALYGGSVFGMRLWNSFSMDDWGFVGTIRVPKLTGNQGDFGSDTSLSALQAKLDRVTMGLRTFKGDPIGYSAVLFGYTHGLPIAGAPWRGFGHEYVPLGNYSLTQEDLPELASHLALMRKPHAAVEAAAARLSSSSLRLSPRDKIIDSVVGLETLLLASVGNAQYRGELRFRFALHYALLQTADQRKAFQAARQLYDLRSALAHGGTIPETARLDESDIPIGAVAARATEMLRETIRAALPSGDKLRYADPEFWQELYFSHP